MEKFAAYLNAIRFWEDEDSGHWEEVRKINASSIGVVVGGLEAMKTMLETPAVRGRFDAARIARTITLLVELIGCGRQALDQILPAECVQRDKQKFRPFDAALLFLIYPINVVGDEMAAKIVSDVETHLRGAIGVRRYIGDSYWCGDYRELLPPEKRSADFSNNLDERDRLLKPGEEAQWCIFDPILSVIHAKRGVGTQTAADSQRQTEYFNRSLGQITDTLQCPEAYFLERGRYASNDNTPLLWTQANLWLALRFMKAAAV
jgi:phosphorylase kinase alpha/beta subunit